MVAMSLRFYSEDAPVLPTCQRVVYDFGVFWRRSFDGVLVHDDELIKVVRMWMRHAG